MLSVIAGDPWPRRWLTTCTGTPASRSTVACVAQVVQPDHGHGGVGLAAASHIARELAPDALRVRVTTFYVPEYQGVIPGQLQGDAAPVRLCWRRTATVCGSRSTTRGLPLLVSPSAIAAL